MAATHPMDADLDFDEPKKGVSRLFFAWFSFISLCFLLALYLAVFGNPQDAGPTASVLLSPDEALDLVEKSPEVDMATVTAGEVEHSENSAAPDNLSSNASGEAPDHTTFDPSRGLPPVPDPALIARGKYGPMPVISADGRKASTVYARPFDSSDKRPKIGIMIGGMGLSERGTLAAIEKLPGEVSLAFAPYPHKLQLWVKRARESGHEVMLQIPMEPFDFPNNDPGDHALLTSKRPLENIDELDWLLSRFTGYAGVTNYMGAKFTASETAMRPFLEAISARGLFYFDDGASNRSQAETLSKTLGIDFAKGARNIDNVLNKSGIDLRLLELEEIAREKGYAIGVGSSYPVTIRQVADWSATLEAKGLVLAPISFLATQSKPVTH